MLHLPYHVGLDTDPHVCLGTLRLSARSLLDLRSSRADKGCRERVGVKCPGSE
jgi:hypothetical protein